MRPVALTPPAVNLLVAIAAAPIAFMTIAGLLHWPRALALFGADPRPDRWHTSPTPAFGGIGIFAGFVAAVAAATALGPVGICGRAGRRSRGRRDRLRVRIARRHHPAPPGCEARGPDSGRDRRSAELHLGRVRLELDARLGARDRVARRADERLQPARQHGRPGRQPRHRRRIVLRPVGGVRRPEPRHLHRRDESRARTRRVPSLQPTAQRTGPCLHGRLRAAS